MQLSLFPNNTGNWSEKNGKVTITPVPFVDEVETFNATFGKPNNSGRFVRYYLRFPGERCYVTWP